MPLARHAAGLCRKAGRRLGGDPGVGRGEAPPGSEREAAAILGRCRLTGSLAGTAGIDVTVRDGRVGRKGGAAGVTSQGHGEVLETRRTGEPFYVGDVFDTPDGVGS